MMERDADALPACVPGAGRADSSRTSYRRGFARLLDMPFGRQEVTINIASAAALYRKLVTSTEGYVGEAPIIHQAVALKAAIDAMDTAFAEDRDANF